VETRIVMEHMERVRMAAQWHSMGVIQKEEMKEACLDLLRALYAEDGAGIIITSFTLPKNGEDEFKIWCPDRPIATPVEMRPATRASRVWCKIEDQFVYEEKHNNGEAQILGHRAELKKLAVMANRKLTGHSQLDK